MADSILTPLIKPNRRQQEAIDIIKGSVMLLAGPGTGKTFTVINRIEKCWQMELAHLLFCV